MKQLSSKSMVREFVFKNQLDDPFSQALADQVVDCIETETLLVFDPNDQQRLHRDVDDSGVEVLLRKAKTHVNISEWLCVGCQSFKYGT